MSPSMGPPLHAVIESVKTGRRTGFTYTGRWKFDIADPGSMERVYDALGDRTMYVVGVTNRTLEEWEFMREAGDPSPPITANEGVGVWRDPDTDRIFVDDIVLFFGPKVSEFWALNFAKNKRQKFVLKVDGPTRSFEFLEVDTPWRFP